MTVLNKAEKAEVPPSVIVVAEQPDLQLYASVMDREAFDFVAPPFEHEPLNVLINSAAQETRRRKEALTQAELGW